MRTKDPNETLTPEQRTNFLKIVHSDKPHAKLTPDERRERDILEFMATYGCTRGDAEAVIDEAAKNYPESDFDE